MRQARLESDRVERVLQEALPHSVGSVDLPLLLLSHALSEPHRESYEER